MDFEPCFTDCCMACNSFSSNFRTSSKSQGQGDYKDSINFQEHQNYWVKGRNIRNKFQDRFGPNEDQQQNQFNTYNNCLGKCNKDEDFSDKIRHETKHEKKDIEIFKNSNTPWDSCYANWTNNKIRESNAFKGLKDNENSNSDKLVAETISDLKEKVEFLFKNFKDYNSKILSDGYQEKSHGDYIEMMSGDVSHLFDINKRLSVAEKSIQKLTFILEYLFKESNKKQSSFVNKNLIFSEPLNFEEMPITQRINLLKNRNDFLFDFMRDFLQVRSIEELNSMLDLMPRSCESDLNPWNSTIRTAEENQSNSFNRENVMELLKELRKQVSKENKETPPNQNEGYPMRNEKRGENLTKCYRNKLEVISEQAELAFFCDNDNDHGNLNKFEIKSNELLKEKLSEVKQDSIENSEKTTRLLAQEAMLKSSLDKVDFDIFLNGDSSEKNLTFTKNSPVSLNTETSAENNNEGDSETTLDSSRTLNWKTESMKKSKVKNTGKFRIHEEPKKEIKQGRKLEPTSSGLPKRNFFIKEDRPSDSKNQPLCKVLQQKSHTLLRPTVRPKESGCYLPEICTSPREETKKEMKIKNQRPMSTPGFHNKTLQTSEIRVLVPEKNRKKNSGINNVKNKNKLLLSQKFCVRTT